MTPSGIDPATFRLVAQCLNQLRHRVPPKKVQGDQTVFVHLMITIQLQRMLKESPADRQCQGDTRLTLTPSVIPNSNYVIMVSD
jgi:hypothetical protein